MGLRVLVVGVLVVALSACANPSGSASTSTPTTTTTTTPVPQPVDLRRAVENAVDSLYLAFEAADSSAAASLFVEDGVSVDKFGGEWIGGSRIGS